MPAHLMLRLRRIGSYIVAVLWGCAPPVARLAPDSSAGHGHEFESLAVAALIVLVLIPMLVTHRR